MRIAPVLLAAVLAGCSPVESRGYPSTGLIVARDLAISIGSPPTIHVKESEQEECGVVYVVRESTPISRRDPNGRLARATVSDLTVGKRVTVWSDFIAESCPAQGGALAVEILD